MSGRFRWRRLWKFGVVDGYVPLLEDFLAIGSKIFALLPVYFRIVYKVTWIYIITRPIMMVWNIEKRVELIPVSCQKFYPG